MNTLNRRAMLTAGAMGIAGFVGVDRADAAREIRISTEPLGAEFERLAAAPRDAADYKRLAELARLGKNAAENRGGMLTRTAIAFRKNVGIDLTQGQAWDAARALEHVAEHERDVAEALDHLIETFEGLAEPFADG